MRDDDIAYPTIEQWAEFLWRDTDADNRLYCIMDGFWAAGLYGRLLNSPDISWAHLFQGDVATRNVQQAPFIIALKAEHKLTRWLFEKGFKQGWGIYFTASTKKAKLHYDAPPIHDKRFLPSNADDVRLGNLVGGEEDVLWAVRRHFRQFSDVLMNDSGKIVDFRYYDPWVTYTYLTTANEKQYRDFTRIITRFFGEAHLVSRPREVFNASLYRIGCQDKKMVFLNERREVPYHINHAQRENPASPPMPFPLTVITAVQEEAISKARQEKFAYIFHDDFAKIFNIKPNYDLFLEIKATIRYCVQNDIRRASIIRKFIIYRMLNNASVYDLSQFPRGMFGAEKENFLEQLLDRRLKKWGNE